MPDRINIHRAGTTVSLWRGTGSRLDFDVSELADILRALGLHKHSISDAIEWSDTVHALNQPVPR